MGVDPKRRTLRNPASVMLDAISHILKRAAETGLKLARTEVLSSLEKLGFDQNAAEKYLNGVGTLMGQQAELGIVSREEVEESMEANEMDDQKVIELFRRRRSAEAQARDRQPVARRDQGDALAHGGSTFRSAWRSSKCLSIYRS